MLICIERRGVLSQTTTGAQSIKLLVIIVSAQNNIYSYYYVIILYNMYMLEHACNDINDIIQ